MVANSKVGQQIDAINVEPFARCSGDGRESFNRRRSIADARRVANKRKQRLRDTTLTIGDLQNSFTGDLIDRRLKRGRQGSIDDRDGHDYGDAEGDTEKSQRRAQPVALHMPPGDRG